MADIAGATLEELKKKERKLRADILRNQRRISLKRKRELTGGFTDFEITFALRIYVLDSFCTTSSVTWLTQQQSQRRESDTVDLLSVDELSVLVENQYLDLSDVDAAQLVHSALPAGQKQILRAQNLLQERRLRDWIVVQNMEKGLAPLSSSTAIQWDALQQAHVHHPFVADRGDLSANRNRMWIMRYRSRWGLRLGKIPARDFMESSVIHDKAQYMEAF